MSDEVETVEENDDIRSIIQGAIDDDKSRDEADGDAEAQEWKQEPEVLDSSEPVSAKVDEKPDSQAEGVDSPVHEEPTAQDQAATAEDRAPSSWSPKVREKWANIDPEVRAEIARVHHASVEGVQKLQEQFTPVRQFAESLAPFMHEAQQLGVHPVQHIHNTLQAERALRTSDPAGKLNALLNIADQYGIPIRQYISGQEQPPAPQAQQNVPMHLPPEVQDLIAFKQRFEQDSVERMIAQVSGKEFFNDVQDIMAGLLESGLAADLTDAYDKACLHHPEVRKVIEGRKEKERQDAVLNQRRQSAAQVGRLGTEDADVQIPGDKNDDSLRGILMEQMYQSGGRV